MKLRSVSIALLLSLLLHLMLVGGTLLIAKLAPKPVAKSEPITIEVLDQKPAPPTPQPVVKKVQTPLEQNQIVEQEEKALNDEVPDNSRFLSIHNQKVVKQTQAMNHGEFQNLQTKDVKAGKPEEKKAKTLPDLQKFFTSDEDPMHAMMKKQEQKTIEETESAQKGGTVSQTSDYLKDVDQSVETMLNTREFKYYTYYSRIRKQLSQYWEPKVKEKMTRMFRQGRTIASNQDRITKLLIILDSAGTLVNVQVLSDSGVRDLDDAAVEAFRAAAPFPNPPKGIIESDGTVKIRWDFVLES